MLVWGATPILTRIALEDLAPLVVATLRTIVAGALAVPLLVHLRQPFPRAATSRRLLAVSAAAGFVIFPVVYTVGQQRTSGLHGVMILAALPIFTGTYASLVARRRPREGRGRLGRTRGSGRGAAPGSASVPPSAPASSGAGKTASRTVLLSSPNHTTSSGSSQTSVSLQPVRKWPLALVPTRRWCHTGRERT